MTIYNNALELIGKTPLIELEKLEKELDLKARVIAKVEFFNPAGSVKDRIAKKMIDVAEKEGVISVKIEILLDKVTSWLESKIIKNTNSTIGRHKFY